MSILIGSNTKIKNSNIGRDKIKEKELQEQIDLLNDNRKHLNILLNKKDMEIERLNNIINELEKYIEFMLKEFNFPEEVYTLKQIERISNKLKELKENKDE